MKRSDYTLHPLNNGWLAIKRLLILLLCVKEIIPCFYCPRIQEKKKKTIVIIHYLYNNMSQTLFFSFFNDKEKAIAKKG